jgi:hypothetical protein
VFTLFSLFDHHLVDPLADRSQALHEAGVFAPVTHTNTHTLTHTHTHTHTHTLINSQIHKQHKHQQRHEHQQPTRASTPTLTLL